MSPLEDLEARQLLSSPDSGIDTTFGVGGVASPTPTGHVFHTDARLVLVADRGGLAFFDHDGAPISNVAPSAGWRQTLDAAVRPDGTIVVLTRNEPADVLDLRHHLRRFNPDGSPDLTFSGDGVVELPRRANVVALQPAGAVVVGDAVDAFGDRAYFDPVRNPALRFLADGTPDRSFHLDAPTESLVGASAAGLLYTLSSAVIECRDDPYGACDQRFTVRRFLPDGSPDLSYGGGDGVATFDAREFHDDDPQVLAPLVLPDGTFLALERHNDKDAANGTPETYLRRFPPDGGAGSAWGSAVGNRLVFGGERLAALPDGVIAAAGLRFHWVDNGPDLFDREGLAGIGEHEEWETRFGTAQIRHIALQPDGMLLVSSDAGLVRYRAHSGAQRPFDEDHVFTIGDRIEAEHFDQGYDGGAYHDTDSIDQGGAGRFNGVDVGVLPGGQTVVGYAAAGEWLEYTIDVPETGSYPLAFSAANPAAGAIVHFEIDGQAITGPIDVPATGGFDVFRRVYAGHVYLPRGRHVLRLSMDRAAPNGAVGNFDWLQLNDPPPQTPFKGSPFAIDAVIEAEDYDVGGFGLSYYDIDTSNTGGDAHRADGVDVALDAHASGGRAVVELEVGEWLEYTFEVPADGLYYVFARGREDSLDEVTPHELKATVDGIVVKAAAFEGAGPSSGLLGEVRLAAGRHVLRVTAADDIDQLDALFVAPAGLPKGVRVADFGRAEPLAVRPDGKVIALHDGAGRKARLVLHERSGTEAPLTRVGLSGDFIPLAAGWSMIDRGVQLTRMPDGGFLLSEVVDANAVHRRFLPDGRLDRRFAGGAGALRGGPVTVRVHPVTGAIYGLGFRSLRRWTPAGVPDRAFGRRGVVRLPETLGAEGNRMQNVGYGDFSVARDGRVLLAGVGFADDPAMFVAVFRRDGRLDRSFGDGGLIRRTLPSDAEWHGIATIKPGGRPIAVRVGETGGGGSTALIRGTGTLDLTGAFDSSFAFTPAGDLIRVGRGSGSSFWLDRLVAEGNGSYRFAATRPLAVRSDRQVVAALPGGGLVVRVVKSRHEGGDWVPYYQLVRIPSVP